MDYNDVIRFWFSDIDSSQWFKKDEKFDIAIKSRFQTVLDKAKNSELFQWRDSIKGRLAEIIVLDQFSRNIYRGQKESFSQDSLALALSQEGIKDSRFESLTSNEKAFFLMPFMHSESLVIHEKAVELFSSYNLDSYLDYEIKHKNIIEKFGRYPHRNEVLGRVSTSEELHFLTQKGSSF